MLHAIVATASADLKRHFSRFGFGGLRIMLGHVRLRMTENGLGMFQSEFFPNNIRICVAQLVRNPSIDSSPLTGPCDGSAVG